jgi:hypothetical protein
MLDGILKVTSTILNLVHHDLSKVGHLVLHGRLHLMKLVPQVFLDLWHVTPCIHPISLNIRNLLLELLLLLLVALNVFC